MKLNLRIVAGAFAVALMVAQGCTFCHPGVELDYNFKPDAAMVTKVGSAMLEWNERHTSCYNPPAWIVRTLTYSGIDSTRIRMMYRERPSGMPHIPVTQNVIRNIKTDSVVVFRHTRIRVLAATDTAITFVVLDDPSFELDRN